MNAQDLGVIGALLILANAMLQFAVNYLTVRRSTKQEDQAEGARRQQLTDLLELAEKNEDRYEEFVATQATVRALAQNQAAMAEDVKGALAAANAASKAVTDLATGLAVKVSFGATRIDA